MVNLAQLMYLSFEEDKAIREAIHTAFHEMYGVEVMRDIHRAYKKRSIRFGDLTLSVTYGDDDDE